MKFKVSRRMILNVRVHFNDYAERIVNYDGIVSLNVLISTVWYDYFVYLFSLSRFQTESVPNTVRRRYIIGASFDSAQNQNPLIPMDGNITAWFNNDPYHSPGIALGMVLNSVYNKMIGCNDCILRFINHPLPYTASTKIKQILNGQTMGFQLAFNMAFSMSFVASFYVLFIVKENVCKSKHLQIVSGVKIWVFWVASFVCDMITYLITIGVLLISLSLFQEDGFKTAEDIGEDWKQIENLLWNFFVYEFVSGRLFLIFLYFGWSFLPLFYLFGYVYDVPSTGYTRMTLFSIFTGKFSCSFCNCLIRHLNWQFRCQ